MLLQHEFINKRFECEQWRERRNVNNSTSCSSKTAPTARAKFRLHKGWPMPLMGPESAESAVGIGDLPNFHACLAYQKRGKFESGRVGGSCWVSVGETIWNLVSSVRSWSDFGLTRFIMFKLQNMTKQRRWAILLKMWQREDATMSDDDERTFWCWKSVEFLCQIFCPCQTCHGCF